MMDSLVSKAKLVGLKVTELNSWASLVENYSKQYAFIIKGRQTKFIYKYMLYNDVFVIGLNEDQDIIDIYTRLGKHISFKYSDYTIVDLFPNMNDDEHKLINYNHILFIDNHTHELQLLNDNGDVVARRILDIPYGYEFIEYLDSLILLNNDGTLIVCQYLGSDEINDLMKIDKQGKVTVYEL